MTVGARNSKEAKLTAGGRQERQHGMAETKRLPSLPEGGLAPSGGWPKMRLDPPSFVLLVFPHSANQECSRIDSSDTFNALISEYISKFDHSEARLFADMMYDSTRWLVEGS